MAQPAHMQAATRDAPAGRNRKQLAPTETPPAALARETCDLHSMINHDFRQSPAENRAAQRRAHGPFYHQRHGSASRRFPAHRYRNDVSWADVANPLGPMVDHR